MLDADTFLCRVENWFNSSVPSGGNAAGESAHRTDADGHAPRCEGVAKEGGGNLYAPPPFLVSRLRRCCFCKRRRSSCSRIARRVPRGGRARGPEGREGSPLISPPNKLVETGGRQVRGGCVVEPLQESQRVGADVACCCRIGGG